MSGTRQPDPILVLDTATQIGIVGLGDPTGTLLAADAWPADHLHGERLLASIRRVLADAGASLPEIGGLVVGTGPGSFTGLRVGLATAKGLAFGLEIPMVGVETAVALAEADWADVSADERRSPADGRMAGARVVLQPAGPGGRYRSLVETDGRSGARLAEPPRVIAAEDDPEVPPGGRLLVVDLPAAPRPARAGEQAWAAERARIAAEQARAAGELSETAGERARAGLAGALLRLGGRRLAATQLFPESAALAELVPVYVLPPRGSLASSAPIQWSRDPR